MALGYGPHHHARHAYTHYEAAVESRSAPIGLSKEHCKGSQPRASRSVVPVTCTRQALLLARRPPNGMSTSYRKIGIIREGKKPADRRVPLTPAQCKEVMQRFPDVDLVVQRSDVRAYTDAEYEAFEIPVGGRPQRPRPDDWCEGSACGHAPSRTRATSSSAIRSRSNRTTEAFAGHAERGIRLIDHELLTDPTAQRVLAFGYWAGVVGAYNGFRGMATRHGGPDLKAGAMPATISRNWSVSCMPIRSPRTCASCSPVVGGSAKALWACWSAPAWNGSHRLNSSKYPERRSRLYRPRVLGSVRADDGKPHSTRRPSTGPLRSQDSGSSPSPRAHMYLACHFWDPRGPKILSASDDSRIPKITSARWWPTSAAISAVRSIVHFGPRP
jgi:saccharopine dehydrogenase (NAD+, L-lysine-forming)